MVFVTGRPVGSIPMWIVNKTAPKQPLCIAAVRRVLESSPQLVRQVGAKAMLRHVRRLQCALARLREVR